MSAPSRSRRPSRSVLVAAALALVLVVVVVVILVLTRGPSSPGEVTFSAGPTGAPDNPSVEADPTVWCDVRVTDCENEPSAVVSLPLPPGTDVGVAVPDDVVETPWQVAFTFRDGTGAEQSARSPVFAPGQRAGFTLALPDPAARLERVEVQQYGAAVVSTPEGQGFATRATWVLAAA